MELQTKFEHEIIQREWWKKAQPIVVAVSTGIDSMVLLDLIRHLSQVRPQIIVAHVNHQLRAQSQTEEEFLKNYCKKYHLQLQLKHWEHEELSGGVEEQARKVRYHFFETVMKQNKAQVLITAHQQNDQAETVLMKLIRSGNLGEVAGMEAVRDFAGGKLIRPLLNYSRLEIENYARNRDLTWFEDQTNQTDEVQRNRIRHHVIPTLVKENEHAVAHLANFAHQLQQQNQQYQQIISQKLRKLPGFKLTADSIEIDYLPANYSEMLLKQMIKELVPLSINQAKMKEINQLLLNSRKPQGVIQLGNGLEFQKIYQKIRIKKIKNENKIFREASGFMVVLNHWYELPNGNSVAIFNFGRVPNGTYQRRSYFWLKDDQFPLRIRPSQLTDRIKLKGGGQKKLRRILIDHKVPNDQREQVCSLVSNNQELLSILGIQESSTKKAEQTNLYVLLVK